MSNKAGAGRKKRRWLIWLFELFIILAIVFAIRGWQQRSLVSGSAPEIDEITVQGEQISLEEFKGKPLLLHFWSSVCSTCDFQQSGLSELAKDWKLVTIAYHSGEAEAVQRYMERENITDWVTIVDNDGELAQEYGVSGVPTSFVLDGEGRIRFREVGLTSGWGLKFRLWLAKTLF
ncbi:MAG: redoxin family protein [Thiolinea sp.]